MTLVLETPEHFGRVRGTGEGATFISFSSQPHRRRSTMTNEEMSAYMNVQLHNMRQSLMEEIREQVQQETFICRLNLVCLLILHLIAEMIVAQFQDT